MVKGISKRVIVVKSPDPRFFEEAIFLVKDEALCDKEVSPEQIMQEAERVAAGYLRRHVEKRRRKLPWILGAAGIAAAALVVLCLAVLL